MVEAEGRWVLPGMLDIHTHYDLEVELAPGQRIVGGGSATSRWP